MAKNVITKANIGMCEGSKGKGVAALQDYLDRFGYLCGQPTAGIFEADDSGVGALDLNDASPDGAGPAHSPGTFDTTTKDALCRFQRFAGVEETGVVDSATRELLNTPRCGVPDVAEFVTGVGRWNQTELTYSFANYTNDLPPAEITAAIAQAFGLWAAETPLRFRRIADGTAGDIVIGFATGEHGDGSPFDGSNGTLAHAFFPSNSGDIRGDTHFDDAETWSVDLPASGTDLVTVAAHEFGHALGLRHSQNESALMAPFYGGPRRFLGTDDIAGIQSLYGATTTAISDASWIHGNTAMAQNPDRLSAQRFGPLHRFTGPANSTEWIHLAVPTPTMLDGDELVVERFVLRARTGEGAILADVHLRDGEQIIARLDGVDRSGDLSLERFGIASMPTVRFGLSASLRFRFGSGAATARQIDLIAGGFEFRRS